MAKINTAKKRGLPAILVSYLKTGWEDAQALLNTLANPKKRTLILRNSAHFLNILYKRITTEGVLKESASLTYITLLGFVPFITFIFMITPDLPFLNIKDKLRSMLGNNMFPGSAQAIMQYFDEFIARRTAFNIVGFIILIVASYSLFRTIRNTFDRILNTDLGQTQDLLSQLIKFFGTLIFGLIIMVMLFSSSSLPIISVVLKLPLLRQLNYIVPFFMQFFGIIFLYMLLPSIRVSRRSLFRGAFWTTMVWVIVKSVFDIYIYNLTSIQAVYGVMSALPIFLMWIYFNWVVVIGGIVLVSVLENKDHKKESIREPRKTVRLTVEMFSNDHLTRRLESLVDKQALLDALAENKEGDEQ